MTQLFPLPNPVTGARVNWLQHSSVVGDLTTSTIHDISQRNGFEQQSTAIARQELGLGKFGSGD
jgi:hypothetical protein